MSGGPIDLTPFGSVLTGIGILYWLLAALALYLAVRKPATRRGKWTAGVLVTIAFGAMPAKIGWDEYQARSRLAAAMALFEERCKSAGEMITRKVEGVDGIVWIKWRPDGLNSEQFALDDPYGKDCSGEGCILRLLRATAGLAEFPDAAKRHSKGYGFVETIDPKDGIRYRYVAVLRPVTGGDSSEFRRHVERTGFGAESDGSYFTPERKPIERLSARYGLTWDDISTGEDRDMWIAGGTLKAIDLQANEVVAERIGYLIDTGQGSTAGFRDPWGWAKAYAPRCPRTDERTWEFSTKVLQPKEQGEQS